MQDWSREGDAGLVSGYTPVKVGDIVSTHDQLAGCGWFSECQMCEARRVGDSALFTTCLWKFKGPAFNWGHGAQSIF